MMTSPLALSGPLGSSAEGDPADPADGAADPTGGPADPARVTVRLPEQLKRRAESLAVDADQSLNTWIVQAIRRATTPPPDPTPQHGRSRRVTGWA